MAAASVRTLVVIAWLSLLAGCASPAPRTAAPPPPASQLAPPVPEEVAAALIAELPPPSPAPSGPRLNIDVDQVPARNFFMSLVADSELNMVVHPAVEGSISLTLKNVSVDDVMDLLREVYGYEYERRPGGYVVMPARLQSRVFQVDVLNLKRSGESRTRVNAGELYSGDGAGSASQSSSGGNGGRSSSPEQLFSSRVETRTESDHWTELREALHTLVGDGGGRSVIVSPQSSMVLVRALPSELREVERYLRDTQRALHRQVVLEAKILEVTLNEGFQSGINWAALADSGRGTISQTGGGSFFGPGGRSDNAGALTNLDPENFASAGNTAASAFGGIISLLYQRGDFAAMVELLETQGDVRVLSSPRVSTTNNQKAVIKVGSDEFFVTEVSTTTTAVGTSAQTTPSLTLTPFFSGISLDVTPQIDERGVVLLHVQPTISEVVDQNKEIVLGGEDSVFNLPLAFSTVRQTDTIVRARNRQLVVIGGLMRESSQRRDARVPWLGGVPVLGNLFKQKKDQLSKTELVILLRPTVIENDADWAQPLSPHSEAMRLLQESAR